MNGPEATAATKTTANNLTVNRTVKESITGRVPEAEPWGGHDEEQENIAQAASPDSNFSATDIDMASIMNNQQPTPEQTTQQKSNARVTNPRGPR